MIIVCSTGLFFPLASLPRRDIIPGSIANQLFLFTAIVSISGGNVKHLFLQKSC